MEYRSEGSETVQEDDSSDDDRSPVRTPAKIPRAPINLGKNNTTKWNKHAPNQAVRIRSWNIISQLPGPRRPTSKTSFRVLESLHQRRNTGYHCRAYKFLHSNKNSELQKREGLQGNR